MDLDSDELFFTKEINKYIDKIEELKKELEYKNNYCYMLEQDLFAGTNNYIIHKDIIKNRIAGLEISYKLTSDEKYKIQAEILQELLTM